MACVTPALAYGYSATTPSRSRFSARRSSRDAAAPLHTRLSANENSREAIVNHVAIGFARSCQSSLMYPVLKRAFDIVASAAAIVIFSPVLATLAVLIKWHDGGPVLYAGRRV